MSRFDGRKQRIAAGWGTGVSLGSTAAGGLAVYDSTDMDDSIHQHSNRWNSLAVACAGYVQCTIEWPGAFARVNLCIPAALVADMEPGVMVYQDRIIFIYVFRA